MLICMSDLDVFPLPCFVFPCGKEFCIFGGFNIPDFICNSV